MPDKDPDDPIHQLISGSAELGGAAVSGAFGLFAGGREGPPLSERLASPPARHSPNFTMKSPIYCLCIERSNELVGSSRLLQSVFENLWVEE